MLMSPLLCRVRELRAKVAGAQAQRELTEQEQQRLREAFELHKQQTAAQLQAQAQAQQQLQAAWQAAQQAQQAQPPPHYSPHPPPGSSAAFAPRSVMPAMHFAPQQATHYASPAAGAAAAPPQPQGKAKGKRAASEDAAGAGGPAGVKRAKPAKAAGAGGKKKGADRGERGGGEEPAPPPPPGSRLGDFVLDEESETQALMAEIERTRRDNRLDGSHSVQILSAFRLTHEGRAAARRAGGGAAGAAPACLDALQLGFRAHAVGLLRRAQRAAAHREATAGRRPAEGWAPASDPRREVGAVRRREEAAAEAAAAAEREALLKAAGSK
jgi:hypothetical protein